MGRSRVTYFPSERKEEQLREYNERLRAKLVNELRRAGDSSYNDYHFSEALESYG
jgi:hypothetical protein